MRVVTKDVLNIGLNKIIAQNTFRDLSDQCVFNLIKWIKNAFKAAIYVKLQVISMTPMNLVGNYEIVAPKWDSQLPLEEKLKTLRELFNVASLDKIPFWKLYKTVKKLNSS